MEQLSIEESWNLLRKYGISLPETILASSKGDAVKAARKIGFPVVIKVYSQKLLHKSDVGGVKLGVKSIEEAEKAYGEIVEKVGKENVEGMLVQKFYEGHWVIVGMKRDAQFGPVIAFGMGGVFVEVMKDVVLRIAPVGMKDAMEMIHEIKGISILEGARGGVKANLDKIASAIAALSKLSMEHPELQEIDLNPLVVNEKEAVAVDVRMLK